jgi:hypothetical protein
MAERLLKATAAPVFFGGESLAEEEAAARRTLAAGRGVILDYAGDENGHKTPLDLQHTECMLSATLEAAGRLRREFPGLPVGVALKCSTLENTGALEHASAQLRCRDRDGVPPDAESHRTVHRLQAALNRLLDKAAAEDVRLFVDAEQSRINPAIREVAYEANRLGKKPVITLQAYSEDAPQRVSELLHLPNPVEVKLVRGAYKDNPTEDQDTLWRYKAQTDAAYHWCLNRLAHSPNVRRVYCATHNEQSVREAVALSKDGAHAEIQHAKLRGMGDYTQRDGLPVSDYIPFYDEGKTLKILGYFGRRGAEMLGAETPGGPTRAALEMRATGAELLKRMKTAAGFSR